MDYRDLNLKSQHNAYSLPLITNMLWRQQGKEIFSVLGLKDGHHQMPVAKRSQDATTTSTPLALMPWEGMRMGVKKGNAQFQRMMEDLLKMSTAQLRSWTTSLSPAGWQR